MKRLLQILILTTALSGLSAFVETKNAVACYAYSLPNIRVGNNMKDVFEDLLKNGGCGETLIIKKHNMNTFLICAPLGDLKIKKLLVRDWTVIQVKDVDYEGEDRFFRCQG